MGARFAFLSAVREYLVSRGYDSALVDARGGSALDLGARRQKFTYPRLQARYVGADSLQKDRRQSALLVQERLENVFRCNLGMAQRRGGLLRLLQSLLGTDGQLVEIHKTISIGH